MKSKIYQMILDNITLDKKHYINLVNRGFQKDSIEKNNYKSWPYRRAQLASIITDQFNVEKIPGFWRDENGIWNLAGAAGLVVPVRNFDSSIESFKIRIDSADSHGKYISLSTNPKKNKSNEIKYPEGTQASTSVHYPLTSKEFASETLVITEGEIKADLVCLHMQNVYCVSIPGVLTWEWALHAVDQLKPKKILLAFDADKNKECSSSKPESTSFVVAKSLAKMYLALKEKNLNVKILDWNEQYGKGIDDVLVAGFADKINELDNEESKKFCEQSLKDDLFCEWLYIIQTKRFYNNNTDQHLDKEQFDDKFSPKYSKTTASKIMLRNPAFTRIDCLVYEPKKEAIFEKDNLKYLNTWKPTDITQTHGNAKMFYDHLMYILPDEIEREIFLDWFAFNVQFPGVKINWAILIQGVHGTGKSYFTFVMQKMIGKRNVSILGNEEFHEKYTDWGVHCSFVIFEEIMGAGKIATTNKLKTLITQDEFKVRSMHKGYYPQPNKFNFLLYTNYKDSIVIDNTERRYCIFHSPAIKSNDIEKMELYFKNLFDWTDKNSGEILYQLMNRDLSKFNPKSDAPITTGKKELVRNSLKPVEVWIEECIEDKLWPFEQDVISANHLLECLPTFVKNCSPQFLGRTLAKMGATQLKQIRLDGNRLRVWCVRNNLKWENSSEESIINEYTKWLNNNYKSRNPLLNSKPF